jgi:hypothetical protein
LQQSAEELGRAALEAVAKDINELERLCVEIDASITARDWSRLDTAIAESRRVTHSAENAMELAAPYRTTAFDAAAFGRLREIFAYREERMQTLQAIHDDFGDRLRQLSRWKTYARSIAGGEGSRRSAGLDSHR